MKEYLPQLKEKSKNKFVISLNKTIEVFPESTFLSFVDCISFYKKDKEQLINYPLIIGRHSKDIENEKLNNTILLKTTETYDRTLKAGIYSSYLAGLFALSLGIYLLNSGTIYLLGFDGGILPQESGEETITIQMNGQTINVPVEDVTNKLNQIEEQSKKNLIQQNGKYYRLLGHFYQGTSIEHRGIGKLSFYTKNDKINKVFIPFAQEKIIKIYNVSPQSNINIFKKIDYLKMFNLINNEIFDKNELREWVKKRIGDINEK